MQAFKDEDGLLRIRTKLSGSYEKEDFKFPILLPASDVVVKLIPEEHVKAMHAGSSILLARLREKFWIIRAKRLVKRVLSEPLTYIHEDPNELLPLSPAMFIHGNSNCETPDLDQVDRSSLVKRTEYLQKLRGDLRQRFRNEYLALLVHRGTMRNDALEVGDVVLIGHDNVR
ncbi:DUF5641 domain-containing protein [Trichonephila inaurata madagascariensis]|uniref:DUF5641 domain-containing protein n=1 Tax=Trichonephila inaurata madagascariensis TaxID=2747483 RepID=A0A8X6YEK9_9ARAC|nr:DUF5641 domain-containing protein [Trichonephila inaurata madagascariensis]